MHLLLYLTCFLLFPQQYFALFGNSLKKLREKASSMYKTQKKGVHLNFMGNVASDYPGTNPKYIKINEDNWEEYYSCLKKQEENLGRQLSMTPQAIVGFEGASVKLECRICISPLEKESKELIKWEWAPIEGKHLEPVDYNENIIISPEDKTLHLYNLETSHSGQYMCVLADASTTPYFLTIIGLNESEILEVHSPEAPVGPYPKDFEYIQQYDLILDTEWSDWSTCSACDKIGKRHKLGIKMAPGKKKYDLVEKSTDTDVYFIPKYGYCTIYSKQNRDLTVSSKILNNSLIVDEDNYSTIDELIEIDFNISTVSTTEEQITGQTEAESISSTDLELFTVFEFGIPCDSHILPSVVRKIPQIEARKNEIMMGFCRVKCEKNTVFVVKDRHGNVIEKVNNSAGLYSLKQPMPPLEPSVARTLVYGIKGKSIVLSCPGSMNTDAPIQWQLGDKNLIPEVIAQESNRRIFISITDKIHIKDAKIADSNIYSCWQREELAGTIRLVVEKKLEFNFNHTVMLIGIVIIMCVFLQVFVKAIVGRKYAKV